MREESGMSDAIPAKQKFPRSFWTANTIELFERAAYYAIASLLVVYFHEDLKMSASVSTFLNGTLLWGLIYFLPIVSGTLADKYGYKRLLSISFFMIAAGYFVMGNVQRFWPDLIGAKAAETVNFIFPVVLAIVLIGLGGSIVKPCIAGTVQKTSGTRAVLGFGIFYMVINIGSVLGRMTAYEIRKSFLSKLIWNIGEFLKIHSSSVFTGQTRPIQAVFTRGSIIFALIGLAIVLLFYKEPEYVSDGKKDGQKVQKKTLGQALLGIFTVLSDLKFVFFLIVMALFWFLYTQLYNLMPLFLRFVDPNAAPELYTLANPLMIVSFQLLITKMAKKWTAIKSILFGVIVTTIGMLLNVLPPLLSSDITHKVNVLGLALPFAGIFLLISIASMATGEMLASPRIYEYLGGIAPKGQEGLYLGYANLPIALGSILSGALGGAMFEKFIVGPLKSSLRIAPNGFFFQTYLDKNGPPVRIVPIWLIIAAFGVCSMVGLMFYDRLVVKTLKK